jgi:hypothetical protein
MQAWSRTLSGSVPKGAPPARGPGLGLDANGRSHFLRGREDGGARLRCAVSLRVVPSDLSTGLVGTWERGPVGLFTDSYPCPVEPEHLVLDALVGARGTDWRSAPSTKTALCGARP